MSVADPAVSPSVWRVYAEQVRPKSEARFPKSLEGWTPYPEIGMPFHRGEEDELTDGLTSRYRSLVLHWPVNAKSSRVEESPYDMGFGEVFQRKLVNQLVHAKREEASRKQAVHDALLGSILERRRVALHPTIENLVKFADLESDWDSYGANPPAKKALITAAFVATMIAENFASLAGKHALPWSAVPLASGGIQLEWRGPEGSLEIDIDTNGQRGYLIEVVQGDEMTYQEGENITDDDLMRLVAFVLGAHVG